MEPVIRDVTKITHTLRDGAPIVLRPVGPDDRERLRIGFSRLSETTRFQRFFRGMSRLREDDITYLTQIDHANHVAWAALDPTDPSEPGLGLARFIRDANDPTTAEVAWVVLDAHQRRGIGTILLAILLIRAKQVGVTSLRAIVRPDNGPVLDWMRGLGAEESGEPGLIHEFHLPVGRPVSFTPAARDLELQRRELLDRVWGESDREGRDVE